MEIYLDNSATTKPDARAVAAAVAAMETAYGNPSSLHHKGLEAELMVSHARETLAGSLGCDPGELLFTSGATESNNLAILGGAEAGRRRGKTIVTTAVEHPSVLEPLAYLEKQGYTVKRLFPDKNGRYNAGQFAQAVDEDTLLVSCMQVNNETGLILPVEEIVREVKAKKPDVLVHIDGVQGFLRLPIRLKNSGIDLFSLSGHKVCAPKGVGALYIRRGVRILPRIYGGGQQSGLRSGTEATPLIAALGAAVEAQVSGIPEALENYHRLNRYLRAKLIALPEVQILSPGDGAPYILCLSAGGVRSEVMLHFLEQSGICVSSGSACARGKQSHVLAAMGLPKSQTDSALRVSFCRDTTEEMLQIFTDTLQKGLSSLAKIRR